MTVPVDYQHIRRRHACCKANQLDTLDLSLGTLSDEGGQAILETPQLKRVKQLDLHHHYLSEDMMEKLKAMYPGVNVDDAEEDDDGHRFIAVSE